jgi:hypothetical protein
MIHERPIWPWLFLGIAVTIGAVYREAWCPQLQNIPQGFTRGSFAETSPDAAGETARRQRIGPRRLVTVRAPRIDPFLQAPRVAVAETACELALPSQPKRPETSTVPKRMAPASRPLPMIMPVSLGPEGVEPGAPVLALSPSPGNRRSWPHPVALLSRLERLLDHPETVAWATEVKLLVDEFLQGATTKRKRRRGRPARRRRE